MGWDCNEIASPGEGSVYERGWRVDIRNRKASYNTSKTSKNYSANLDILLVCFYVVIAAPHLGHTGGAENTDPQNWRKLRNLRALLMADVLPSYPPSLPPKALHFLLTSLTDYCLSHGITVRPNQQSGGNHLASHAPVTLFPSLFPRNAWEQALRIQTRYNELYAKIANDTEWLGKIMEE